VVLISTRTRQGSAMASEATQGPPSQCFYGGLYQWMQGDGISVWSSCWTSVTPGPYPMRLVGNAEEDAA